MTGVGAFPAALRRFVELFNDEQFWESHEVLELPWRENRSEFYHGLILLASAFVHAQRGNRHGVVAQARKAAAALEAFRPTYLGLDVDELLASGERARSGAPIAYPRLALCEGFRRGDEPELAD